MCVKITFDPAKDAVNITKHGVSMALASELDWESAQLWQDTRMEYGEVRIIALALIETRLFYVVFTDRGDYRRIISLRKANAREIKRYVSQD
ncbi:BrnT family toxin [Nitrosomonas sp. Is35]|uniref:BrnT family toxin n=1 Tax=Nitrosomonas sp. Is35 TaxID=3080534 RepID=UPI00294B3AB1|nr:BrnT family toxin [Nitrosomonas sp. Is35]MDV6346796.1 BrnT family toxin [Nitrosomonas sp. Is35]